jgi:AcrR family transcriptional regulator
MSGRAARQRGRGEARPAASTARRREASRRAILAAAFELVGEVGYARLTIEGIAARAGVGKQTIYRWWPSKGAVLFDAFLALSENQEGEAALPDSGDLDADLELVLRATVAELVDPRYDLPLRALAAAMLDDPALTAEWERRLDGPMRAIKRARLLRGQEAGQLPADVDLDLAIDLLWSPLWSRWQNGGELTPAFADALVETVLAGLRAR